VRVQFREASLIVRHSRDTAQIAQIAQVHRTTTQSRPFRVAVRFDDLPSRTKQGVKERIVDDAMVAHILGILPTGTWAPICYQIFGPVELDKQGSGRS
jgi:hypothetical protein